MVESSSAVKPWREAVKTAAREARAVDVDVDDAGKIVQAFKVFRGPVSVTLHFYLPRPKGHYGTGRNTATVKESSPAFPATRPDLDKLTRSTLDALTESGLIHDDSQIVQLTAWKDYTNMIRDTPGVFITVDGAA